MISTIAATQVCKQISPIPTVRQEYETEMYTYPPINIYSIELTTGILYSKQLVYACKFLAHVCIGVWLVFWGMYWCTCVNS